MASRIAKTPLIQAQRQLAAQAATKKMDAGPAFQTSKLANGLTVATFDNGSKLSSVGLLSKAGSRFETYENAGCAHALRAAMDNSTKNFSGFGVCKNVQQAGSHIAAVQGRDYMMYSTQFLAGNEAKVLDYLFDVFFNPVFKHWELTNVPAKLKLEVAELGLPALASELLHKAAYRDGLGNSLYAPARTIGKHSCAQLEAYHQKHFTADRSLLVGLGINHQTLVDFASGLELDKGAGPSASVKYYGGQERHAEDSNMAYVAIAAEGGSAAANPKEATANMLLQKILGDGQKVKHGNPSGKLQQAAGEGHHAVSGLNYVYSDSSLVGAFIACEAGNAGQVVSKVVAAMRNISVTEAEVNAAKKALTVQAMEQMMHPNDAVEIMGTHGLFGASEFSTGKCMGDIIAQATVGDVQAAAKKLSNAKLSMGAAGNLATVPYIESL